MEITIKITNKAGEVLHENSYTGKDEYALTDCVGRPLAFPVDKTLSAMETTIIDAFVFETVWKFLPYLVERSAKLVDIKPSDKKLKKSLRGLDFETTENLLYAAHLYTIIYEKEKNKDAAYNIAILYYLTGYLTDSEEWFKLSESTETWISSAIEFKRYMRKQFSNPLKEKTVKYN